MNKKGQFFLIAALVIAGIIITLGAINISTRQVLKEDKSFYDLSKEINYESSQLIDYGVYQGQNSREISDTLVSLASNYSAANPDTEMLLVYGNSNFHKVVYYNKSLSGSVYLGGAGSEQFIIEPTEIEPSIDGNNVTVGLPDGSELTFELKPGENFYIVLKKESGGETLVAQE